MMCVVVAVCSSFVGYCLLCVDWCFWFVVGAIASCLLFVVGCSLKAVTYVLRIVGGAFVRCW